MLVLQNLFTNNNFYRLDQILDIPAIQSILEDLTSLTGIGTALLDLEGNVLVATGWAELCTRFHRVHPETSQNCIESDLYLAGHVESGKFVLYKCRNGLWDVVTPLYISGKHMGNIYSGQFFFDDDQLDLHYFRQQARRFGFDEEAYMAALEKVPRIERKKLDTLMGFLVKFTGMLSSSAVNIIELSRTVADYQAAEATLKASEAKSQALLATIPDLIFVIDANGVFLDYRAATDTVLAVPAEQIIGNTISATMPPGVAEASLACINRALTTGDAQTLEYALPLPEGTGYYEARMVKMNNNTVLCVSRDISERKEAEEKVQSSASFLNSVISGSPIPQFLIDRSHTVLQWNQAMERYSGIPAREIVGTRKHWSAFYDHERPCLVDLLIEGSIEAMADFYPGKYRESRNIEGAYEATDFFPRMKDNGRWLYFTAAPVHNAQGEIIGGVETLEDVTESVRKEEELRHMNRIQSLILENTAVGIAFVRNRLIEWSNGRVAEMMGRNPEEVVGKSTRIIYSREEDFQHVGIHAYETLGKGEWYDFEGLMQRADGSNFWGRVLGKALDPAHPQDGTIWIFEDIDQRKKAEEERDSLRHLMKNIIDSMPSILVAVDTRGAVTQWNLEASRITGINSEQALHRPLKDLLPQYISHTEGLQKALAEHEVFQEHRVPSRYQGETRYAEVMIYPLSANAIAGAVVRIDDVTDKVRLEEMMIQTEKMMSIGGLAAGMAHEINNPLSGMMQGIQNIRRRLSRDLPANQAAAREAGLDLEAMEQYLGSRDIIDMLNGIQRAGSRASIIVNNMLQFSRRSNIQKEAVPAAAIIDRALELASNDYDLKKQYDFRHIRILREYEADMPPIWCIPTEIEQVLLNLLKNAAHALASVKPPVREPLIIVRSRREGSMAVLEVEDNGPGMDEALKKRILEPFFTTKEAGVGTGLGLSVSFFIINENHGGKLFVQSVPGQGARFIIHLPLADYSSPSELPPSPIRS